MPHHTQRALEVNFELSLSVMLQLFHGLILRLITYIISVDIFFFFSFFDIGQKNELFRNI